MSLTIWCRLMPRVLRVCSRIGSNLGHMVARGTVANILKKHGIEPSLDRGTNWKEFLSRHWGLLVVADFFAVEVRARCGLQRLVVHCHLERNHQGQATGSLLLRLFRQPLMERSSDASDWAAC